MRHLVDKPSATSFKSRQSLTESLKITTSSLLKCETKKNVVVQYLAKNFSLIAKSKHQCTAMEHANKLKKYVHDFYMR